MRPLNLKMSAFGAYTQTVELNFEKGLGDEKMFLIHGATGSGKTTILDAICFALYGGSSGGDRTGEMMRSEWSEPTAKTEVEFTFALGEKIYTVRRCLDYMRKKNRGVGLTPEKGYTEIFLDDKKIETESVENYVKNLIGFESRQFRQVVLLPQGEFRNFLMADSSERQTVLKVLFNANFYEMVEQGLKEKFKSAEMNLKNLESQKNNFLDDAKDKSNAEEENFTAESLDEIINSISDELKNSNKKIDELKKIFDTANAKLTEGKILNSQFDDFENKTRNLESARENLEQVTNDLNSARVEYEKRRGEENQRQELADKIKNLQEKKSAIVELKKRQAELAKAEEEKSFAEENFAKAEKNKKSFAERLQQRKNEEAELQNAGENFAKAEQLLKDSNERENLILEINKLNLRVSESRKKFEVAEKNFVAAKNELENLKKIEREGRAANLAKLLEDGKPCPVCGAIHHPQPAESNLKIPSDDEIKFAEEKLNRLLNEKNVAEKNFVIVSERVKTQEEQLKKFSELPPSDKVKKIFESAKSDFEELAKVRNFIKKGEECIRKNDLDYEKFLAEKNLKSATADKLRGVVEEKLRQIPVEYSANPFKLDEDLKSAENLKKILDNAWKTADEKFHTLDKIKSEREGAVKKATEVQKESSEKIAGKVKPDLEFLNRQTSETQSAHTAAVANFTKLDERLKNLREISEKLQKLDEEIQLAEKNYKIWSRLSSVARGDNSKISFQRYYLASMFKEVTREANERLEKMSGGRYRLENKIDAADRRKSGGLDLEIYDAYTGKNRPTATLSGGESFLASLSLALGLAAVVQNISGGIKLDTIFIDEGFGTLDSETLDVAMKALIELQSGGRLVGIISHVEELKNRIQTRIEIKKHSNGSTAEFHHS